MVRRSIERQSGRKMGRPCAVSPISALLRFRSPDDIDLRNFRIGFSVTGAILCAVSRTQRDDQHPDTHIEVYSSDNNAGLSLLQWVQRVVESAMFTP